MLLSRLAYYLRSIPTLLIGVKNRGILLSKFLGGSKDRSSLLELANGYKFWVRTLMDIWIIKETCLDRCYREASVPMENGWVVIDIGAGLGDFSVDAAKENPEGTIYAYEPFPESFALLEQNLALNDVRNVRAFRQAISSDQGTLAMRVGPEAVMHSTAAPSNSAAGADEITVPAVSLRQMLGELAIVQCDFMKMDCEGAEYDILLHADRETLRKIRHLCLEYHEFSASQSHRDLVRALEQSGFKVRRYPSPVHRALGLLYAARV